MKKPDAIQDPTPHEKFMKGLRVLFSTTKSESDRQLAEDAELRKGDSSIKKPKNS